MAVSLEIRSIARPKGTIVRKKGNKYVVIKRTSKRKGKGVYPVDIGKVGEIVNGKFIEIHSKPRRKKQIDILDYGEVALCNKCGNDLLEDLCKFWDINDSKRLYVIALLRSSYGNIKNKALSFRYDTSVASFFYPDVHLSEQAISSFLERIGQAYSTICEYMRSRVESFSEGNLVIDGMLKDYNAKESTLSKFSRKARTKGSKDISLLYAFDPKTGEPIAVKPYPGNMLDQTAVTEFVEEYCFKKGTLIMDKGFYNESLFSKIDQMKDFTYLIPLKQNSKLIAKYSMDNPIEKLTGYEDDIIFFKKAETSNGYLYSFRSPKLAYEQEVGYAEHSKEKFDQEKYSEKKSLFGLIVFKSKENMEPLTVYRAYSQRWTIETFFSMYKNILERETVNVHGDYRVYATEFINFLSSVITSRVKHLIVNTGVSKEYSMHMVFEMLSSSKYVRTDADGKFKMSQRLKYVEEMMDKLGV